MAYDYIRRTYGVRPVVGHRVRLEGPERREGKILAERASHGHYVRVKFDGERDGSFCHPRSLEYLGRRTPSPFIPGDLVLYLGEERRVSAVVRNGDWLQLVGVIGFVSVDDVTFVQRAEGKS